MKLIFCLAFVFLFTLINYGQVFHDNQGTPILFFNSNQKVLFDYAGNPKFYFKTDYWGDVNIFNFNGKHIGWYVNGTLRDHQGNIMASETNKLINVTYQMPGIKPLEKLLPLKAVEEIVPMRPLWNNQFSAYSIIYYQGSGTTSSQVPQPYSSPNDYTALQQRKPYQLPVNDIVETVEALNQQYYQNQQKHAELLAMGYIYYKGNYYTKQKYDEVVAYEKYKARDFNNLLNTLKGAYFSPKKINCWIPVSIADEDNKQLVNAIIKIGPNKQINRVIWKNGSKKFQKNTIISRRAQFCQLKEASNVLSAILFGGNIEVERGSIWVFIEKDEEYISKKRIALKTL